MAHDPHPHHDVDNIKIAFFLNLGFTIVEFVGGMFVNSVAIVSDAIHDLGDCISLGTAWYFQKLSHKGRTKTYSYGYRRFSVLSAVLNSIVLLIGSVFILMETLPRLMTPEQPETKGMMLLAVLGVVVNGLAMLKTRKGKSANEKVVSLHMMEDVLGWAAVLIGSIVMDIWTLPVIDPILSLMIACYILFNVFKNLRISLRIILQSTPPDINLDKLKQQLLEIPQVLNVHDMRTWSMDGDYHVMTVHLVLAKEADGERRMEIKAQARNILKESSMNHVTIELEGQDEPCDRLDQ